MELYQFILKVVGLLLPALVELGHWLIIEDLANIELIHILSVILEL